MVVELLGRSPRLSGARWRGDRSPVDLPGLAQEIHRKKGVMREWRREPEESLLDHQARALAEEEPFDELRRDAGALGVGLSLTLPLPEPGERYYADWLDEEGRRAPALDTDVFFYCGDPVELIARCLDAAL
jgi:hypothetical protein